jgi:hypothetical protein
MANLGCAQDADGILLSPSKIKWYNNVDDENPISGGSLSSAAGNPVLSSLAKPTTLDTFFTTPGNLTINSADKVAGSRRSHRVTRPSTRIADPNNAEAPTVTRPTFVASSGSSLSLSLKRKASTNAFAPKPSRSRKVIEDSDDDDAGTASDLETEGGDDIDETASVGLTEKADTGGEDTEKNYMLTKALGDADREVSYSFIFVRCNRCYTST